MSSSAPIPDWATTSGDIWARRWRDTDAALEGLSPHLLSAVVAAALAGPFKAFEIGCGPGSTAIDVATVCPNAAIVACDISPALAAIARERTASLRTVRVLVGAAEEIAPAEGPFDLFLSRHGVMFFPDPVGAFRSLRSGANPGASLVFSCFQSWDSNPWASELARAAAGKDVPAPGREPSGFAFAEPGYVRQIFSDSGWSPTEPGAVPFRYVAGAGDATVEEAMSLLSDVGPASRIVQSMPEEDRPAALERMRGIIERHFDGTAVVFPASAWIWSATAA